MSTALQLSPAPMHPATEHIDALGYHVFENGVNVDDAAGLLAAIRQTRVFDASLFPGGVIKDPQNGPFNRFTTSDIVASASIYLNQYSNRVVSTIDNDPTSSTFLLTIDRNVGKVETKGFEGSLGWSVTDTFSLYGSATYTDARLQEDQDVGTFVCPAVPPTTGNGANCVAIGLRFNLSGSTFGLKSQGWIVSGSARSPAHRTAISERGKG